MKLIDKDERMEWAHKQGGEVAHYANVILQGAPGVDAVSVVRCKYCRLGEKDDGAYVREKTWCIRQETYHNDDWFCADGERRKE